MLSSYFFFWNWDGNPPVNSVSAIAVVAPSRDKHGARGDDYRPLTDEYWEGLKERMTEDYVTGREIFEDAKAMISEAPKNESGLAAINEAKSLVSSLKDARSVDSLKEIAARIRDLRK